MRTGARSSSVSQGAIPPSGGARSVAAPQFKPGAPGRSGSRRSGTATVQMTPPGPDGRTASAAGLPPQTGLGRRVGPRPWRAPVPCAVSRTPVRNPAKAGDQASVERRRQSRLGIARKKQKRGFRPVSLVATEMVAKALAFLHLPLAERLDCAPHAARARHRTGLPDRRIRSDAVRPTGCPGRDRAKAPWRLCSSRDPFHGCSCRPLPASLQAPGRG